MATQIISTYKYSGISSRIWFIVHSLQGSNKSGLLVILKWRFKGFESKLTFTQMWKLESLFVKQDFVKANKKLIQIVHLRKSILTQYCSNMVTIFRFYFEYECLSSLRFLNRPFSQLIRMKNITVIKE